MIDLKKLFALGAVCTAGIAACDVAKKDDADAALTCPAGDGTDATVDPVEVPVLDDAGMPTEETTTACPSADGGAGGGGTGGDGGTGGAPPAADPTVQEVTWDGDNINFKILTGAEDGPYEFGIAETGNAMGWFGEDCLPGAFGGVDVCHTVPADGNLTITHVDAVADVADGKTLFKASMADGLTYVLIRNVDTNSAGCWTWGQNTDDYKKAPPDGLGCNDITPAAAP